MFSRAALEAVVIVGSVMLALAADRWVAGLDERAELIEILGQLEANIRTDSIRVGEALDAARAKQLFAAQLLEGSADEAEPDPAVFLPTLERVGWINNPQYLTATWQDLVATGKAALIADPELRGVLANYYDRASMFDGMEELWVQRGQEYQAWARTVLPAMVRVTALGALPRDFPRPTATAESVQTVMEAFRRDERLRSELGQVMVSYSGQIALYPRFLGEVEELLPRLREASR